MTHAEREQTPEPRPDVDRILAAARRDGATSLAELAEEAHLSRYHLSRLLKKHLGFPLRDFLAAAKVDRGIDVLTDGHDVTRSQVEAGHESASTYHQAFLRHTGMSPSRYRAQMGALAAHLMRHQDRAEPLVALHQGFPPSEHLQPHALTIQVEGAIPGAALFAALHPEPIIRGEPALGIAMLGTSEYEVTAIPDGSYFPMVVEIPRARDIRSYFRMDSNRRDIIRTPVTFPLTEPRSVTLRLRDLIPTDPPITPNMPLLFLHGLLGRIEVEESNPEQAGGLAGE